MRKTGRTCSSEEACDRTDIVGHGLCMKHYKRLQRSGAVGETCSITEPNGERCPFGVQGNGYCEKHLLRWQKYGDPGATKSPGRKKQFPTICTVMTPEGRCNRKSRVRGLCQPHHYRLEAYGDPLGGSPIGSGEVPETCLELACTEPVVGLGRCKRHHQLYRVHVGNGKLCSKGDGRPATNRGLCQLHYQAWYRDERTDVPKCSTPGCTKKVYCKGLCKKCDGRRRRKALTELLQSRRPD